MTTPESKTTSAEPRAQSARRIAAIDVGSNSVRMIIADVGADGTIDMLDEMKAHPRLGKGLETSKALGTESMDAATEAIARMATLAKQFGAQRIEAVGTSAVRDAENAEFFLARVKQATGLKLRVLRGEDEARLSFRSALAHFELGAGRSVIVDIGGGSLQITLAAEGVVDRVTSLPLGAIRLTERFDTAQNPRPRAIAQLRKAVRKAIKPIISGRDWRAARVIGSGGSFTNLAGIHLARQGISAKSVHGTVIPRVDVEHILDTLASMNEEERRATPGVNPDRADIIVAGVAVIAELLARVDAREVAVSRYGIREGLLLEAARVAPVVADPGEARERSVRDLAERCHYEMKHANAVQALALKLFDASADRLGLGLNDRRILADAAVLHEIGYHINYDRHHKHSYHLIQHAELLGMTPEDKVLIATVARYHRGAEPRKKQRAYAELDKALRRRVKRLAGILRVADGFDRGHVGAVASLKVRWLDRAIRITPVPQRADALLRLEAWGAHRKSGLLARVAKRPVEIVLPDGSVLSSEALEIDS